MDLFSSVGEPVYRACIGVKQLLHGFRLKTVQPGQLINGLAQVPGRCHRSARILQKAFRQYGGCGYTRAWLCLGHVWPLSDSQRSAKVAHAPAR
ncbi:MAG: hypothetical protein IPL70_15195 [Uliginosibacterium sp.]|nr:hypothetical protein [Uliginosibacterium sp.]